MPIEAHPSRDEILAYTTGRLDEQSSERIAEHIATCDTCRSVLTAVDDRQDSLVARLRRVVPPDPYAREPECEAALVAAKARFDSSSPPDAEPVAIEQTIAYDSAPPADDLPQLGDYQLLEKLGEGGMGAVYKARHVRLDRVVAIKILPRERTRDQAAVARFAREMKAVGQLNHPNIVQAHDAREIDGTTVLVMEYVEGHDLSQVVRLAGPLRVADACELVRQAAVGLQHAHEHGLVHRDIKPANLMLAVQSKQSQLSVVRGPLSVEISDADGLKADNQPRTTDNEPRAPAIVKILDLGLARLASDVPAGDELTSAGQAMGTADYMAPEQITDSHSADIRADIYSLGCTLYKLLTGEPPFPGPKYKNMMEKMTGHLRDVPRPIGDLRSDVPAGLIAVVQRMMARERAARYATPREAAAALAPFAAGTNLDHLARCAAAADAGESLPPLPTEPYLSCPMTGTFPSPLAPVLRREGLGERGDSVHVIGTAIRQAIRGPALLIALGLFGVLIALGYVIIRILHNDGSETEVAVPTGASATVNPDGSVSVKLPDGSPQKLLVTKRAARRFPKGQWVPLVKSVEDLQAWQRRGDGTVAYINNALQLQDAAVTYPTLAIDLVIRVNVQISVNGPSSARVTLREQPGGSYAAVLEDGKTLVVGVTEKDQWRELKKAAVSIGPDQLVALEFSAVGDVLSVSLDGKPIVEVRDTTYRSGSPGLAVTKGVTLFKDIQVKVLRGEEEIATSGQEPAKRTGASAGLAKVAGVSGPLSARAIVSRPAKIPGVQSWSVELAGHQWVVENMTWSPKGDLIATGGEDSTVRLWDRAGRLKKVLLGHEGLVTSVAFSPDGSLLASSDYWILAKRFSLRVWDVVSGVCVAAVPLDGWVKSVAFSPNGENLVVAWSSRLTILNVRTLRRLEPAEESASDYAAWSPDGSRIMSRKYDGPTIKIWDAKTMKKLAELQVSDAEGKIVGLEPGVWSPDGHSIAAPCSDGVWRIWDGDTFELRKTLKREGDSPLRRPFAWGGALLFWKPNGQLVTPLAAKGLITWDVAKGEVVAEVDFPAAGAVFTLSPDQSELVSWHVHRPYLDFLDAETGKSLRRGAQRGTALAGGVALSPDAQQVVTSAKPRAGVWNANTGQPVARNGNAGGFSDCTWQPSGGLIVGSYWRNPEHELSLFDADTLASAFQLKAEGKGVSSHAWSPDGKLLAAADSDNTIRVWDISKREVISNLVGHEATIWKLAWSPDGKRLASRSEDKTVRLWDPVSGQLLATYEAFPQPMYTHYFSRGLAWTPDSQRLWIGLSTHAVQLDVATGTFSPMEDFSNGNVVTSLSVSSDGHLLARERYGWTYLRTIGADGSPSRRLLGHGLGSYPIWHPDSRRFLGSESDRGHVVTFDIQANRRLGTLFPWITGEHWMCVSPEGHIRGGHFAPDQTKFDPADTAIPASLKEQIVYVALLDDGSQVTLSPDEFAAKFGWQNDPNQAYLLGPTP